MSRFSYKRKRLQKTFDRLDAFYKAMPDTVGCMDSISKPAGHGGCGAWCCKIQNPQLLYCEFLYAFDFILKNWTQKELLVVVEEAVRNYLKDTPTKGCVFFNNKTKMCKIHTKRCFNCHLYGIIPEEEFKPRLERLRKEYADTNAIFKEQCKLVKAENGEKFTMKTTDKWWEKLSNIEHQFGIKLSMITDKPGGTYRTYHDHLLIYLLPDYTLENLSEVRKHGTQDDKEKVIMTLMDILTKALEGIADDPQGEDS